MTDIVKELREYAHAFEIDFNAASEVMHEAAREIGRLRAALKPFADHAETWVRAGFPEHYPLVEPWPEAPPMDDDEPECMDVSFLTVGHLVAARNALQHLLPPPPVKEGE